MLDEKLIQRAESGDFDAILELASAYYSGEGGDENIGKAYGLYMKALDIQPENAQVLNCIGNCYRNDFGVDKNMEIAAAYYMRSAELGYVNGQYNYADSLFLSGAAECIEWYEKAYINGDIDAPLEISNIYKEGRIVPADNEKALEYINKAIDAGNTNAMFDMGVYYHSGECGLVQNDEKAFEYWLKGSED